jgi:hypothetical protein
MAAATPLHCWRRRSRVDDFLSFFVKLQKKTRLLPTPLDPHGPLLGPPVRVLSAGVQHVLGQKKLVLDRSNLDHAPPFSSLTRDSSISVARNDLNWTVSDHPVFKSLA